MHPIIKKIISTELNKHNINHSISKNRGEYIYILTFDDPIFFSDRHSAIIYQTPNMTNYNRSRQILINLNENEPLEKIIQRLMSNIRVLIGIKKGEYINE